jgi:hypothetical protein
MSPLPLTIAGDWVLHRDAAGFLAHVPAGWCVRAGLPGEIAFSEPRGAAAALLRVRGVPAHGDLALWLEQDYARTEPGLHNVHMLEVETLGAQLARAAFDYGGNVFQGRASVVASRAGDIATLYIAAAGRAEFVRRLPALTRILESLRWARAAGREGGIRSPSDLDLARLLTIR